MDWAEAHLSWVASGLDPARFWDITMREVEREMRGLQRRREREANERTSLAWHTVALDRTKKLPKLETLMVRASSAPKRKQTQEQILVGMKTLFLAHGGDPADLRTEQ